MRFLTPVVAFLATVGGALAQDDASQAAVTHEALLDHLHVNSGELRARVANVTRDATAAMATGGKLSAECRAEVAAQDDFAERVVRTRVSNKFSEMLNEWFQREQQYEQCDLGKYYERLMNEVTKSKGGSVDGDSTPSAMPRCMRSHYESGSLKINMRLRAGEPKITFKCGSSVCYECLATINCGLDNLAANLTAAALDLTPHDQELPRPRVNLGNHQAQFDGKSSFVTLPAFHDYSPEFTFEAWVAWQPSFKARTNGATVRIFDFFSEDPERNKVETEEDAEAASDALLQQADRLLQGDDDEAPASGKDDVELKFREDGVWSAEAVSGISLSPGEFRTAAEAMDGDLIGMRVAVDRAELICPHALPHNDWMHVAVTVKSKESEDASEDCCWSIKIYVDGDLACERNDVPLTNIAMDRIMWVVDNNFLGRDQKGHEDSFFEGYMDEVRIWSTARSADDILVFHNRPVRPDADGLVAYYRFDELASATNVEDYSRHGLNGHLGDGVTRESMPERVTLRPETLPRLVD